MSERTLEFTVRVVLRDATNMLSSPLAEFYAQVLHASNNEQVTIMSAAWTDDPASAWVREGHVNERQRVLFEAIEICRDIRQRWKERDPSGISRSAVKICEVAIERAALAQPERTAP